MTKLNPKDEILIHDKIFSSLIQINRLKDSIENVLHTLNNKINFNGAIINGLDLKFPFLVIKRNTYIRICNCTFINFHQPILISNSRDSSFFFNNIIIKNSKWNNLEYIFAFKANKIEIFNMKLQDIQTDNSNLISIQESVFKADHFEIDNCGFKDSDFIFIVDCICEISNYFINNSTMLNSVFINSISENRISLNNGDISQVFGYDSSIIESNFYSIYDIKQTKLFETHFLSFFRGTALSINFLNVKIGSSIITNNILDVYMGDKIKLKACYLSNTTTKTFSFFNTINYINFESLLFMQSRIEEVFSFINTEFSIKKLNVNKIGSSNIFNLKHSHGIINNIYLPSCRHYFFLNSSEVSIARAESQESSVAIIFGCSDSNLTMLDNSPINSQFMLDGFLKLGLIEYQGTNVLMFNSYIKLINEPNLDIVKIVSFLIFIIFSHFSIRLIRETNVYVKNKIVFF